MSNRTTITRKTKVGRKITIDISSNKQAKFQREDLDMAKKGKPYERENESLLIAAQNTITTNYVKLVWFYGISNHRLFNAKSFLNIKYF